MKGCLEMEQFWKEKSIYIILFIIILLLLLITVMASKDKKNRQKLVNDPVLNQNIYPITENLDNGNQKGQEEKRDQPLDKGNSFTNSNANIGGQSNSKKEQAQKNTQVPKVTSTPKQTSKPKQTVTPIPNNQSTSTPTPTPKTTPTPSPVETKNTKTAQQAINEMKIGWNLGNSLDSCNYQKRYMGQAQSVSYYETLWGNPQTTKEMIREIKKAGFGSVRVPVTYYDHIDANGNIDSAWIKRVKEVVNYVLENDMYCILDVHHDTGLYSGGAWIVADYNLYSENASKLSKLWTQIATEFKDYDYKLVFEGFNEIVDTNKNYDWVSGHKNTLNVNQLNQVFVDTVRKTGGKNKDRFLAITTFGGITDEHKLSNFVMPKDSSNNKIILALHDYAQNPTAIDKMLGNIKKYCRDKNIPVILDEFGTKRQDMSEEERIKMASYYVSSARKLGITCFWWDNGASSDYRIFNRSNLSWEHPEIKNALINHS